MLNCFQFRFCGSYFSMKVVKKSESREHTNSDACLAIEYPLGEPDINGAVIKLNGRYPEKGWCMNRKCKELAYVIKGKGIIHASDKEQEISEGDLIFIPPGEKFYWEGEMKMFMPCTPAWTPEQYEYCE